jgi:hypothetical protein
MMAHQSLEVLAKCFPQVRAVVAVGQLPRHPVVTHDLAVQQRALRESKKVGHTTVVIESCGQQPESLCWQLTTKSFVVPSPTTVG